jgi:hypothetical protein
VRKFKVGRQILSEKLIPVRGKTNQQRGTLPGHILPQYYCEPFYKGCCCSDVVATICSLRHKVGRPQRRRRGGCLSVRELKPQGGWLVRVVLSHDWHHLRGRFLCWRRNVPDTPTTNGPTVAHEGWCTSRASAATESACPHSSGWTISLG